LARLRPVDFEDRLTLVEHLDELRSRLIISASVLAVAFALCFWQNHLLIKVANGPLPDGFHPITFSVTEPFMTTVTVVAYGAILISLPVILYELYAFVLPALTPRERGVALPLLVLMPALFVAGVVFGYFVVIPAATKFLLHFNQDQFNIQVRARDYYSFFAMTEIAMGIVFQVPIVILALTRLGITTPQRLASQRKTAVVVIAVIAMALPGTDPITMLIEMVPLLVLFEGSLILARIFGGPARRGAEAELALSEPPAGGPA
jgi:sec-independent protein translocase protein TatC